MSPLDDETLLPQEDEQEMFEHFRLVADKGQAPLRVDKFITTTTSPRRPIPSSAPATSSSS